MSAAGLFALLNPAACCSVEYVLTLRRLVAEGQARSGRARPFLESMLGGRVALRKEIRVGSTVRLKSGGPHMKVDAVFLNPDEGRKVQCSWVDRAKRVSQIFALDDVEPTPEPTSDVSLR